MCIRDYITNVPVLPDMVYHLWRLLAKSSDILVSKYSLGGLGDC